MRPTDIHNALLAGGYVLDTDFPYENVEENEGIETIPESIRQKGKSILNTKLRELIGTKEDNMYVCFTSRTLKIKTVEEFALLLKTYLTLSGPLNIGVRTHAHGECDMWNKYGTPARGGHAMSVVGYGDDGLTIQNSWG